MGRRSHTRGLVCLAGILLMAACGSPGEVITGPTWQSYSISGVPAGLRAAAFDSTRDCVWIVTDQLGGVDGHSVVSIARFDLATHSLADTSLSMNGDAWDKGSIAIDSKAKVWLGWGQTLVSYDPTSDSAQSWALPPYSNVVHPSISTADGRLEALTIASDGEVWVAASSVQALFGFNPSTRKWDRTLDLPFLPTDTTRVAEIRPGLLVANGVELQGASRTFVVAEIDVATRALTTLKPHAVDYSLSPGGDLTYVDSSSEAAKVALSDGATESLASKVPVAHDPDVVPGAGGQLWFSMLAFRSVGVGKLNVNTGSVTTYPFPYISDPGGPLVDDCPTAAFDCVPSNAVFDPEIQALVVDAAGNLWVLTRVAGSAASSLGPSPLYELSGSS